MEYSLIFSLAVCVFFYARMAHTLWYYDFNSDDKYFNDDCVHSLTSIKCHAFPLPKALQPLGYKLTELNIEGARKGVSLKREAFAWFPKLQTISIKNTQISHIENAFNGLTNLWRVTLKSTGLCSSPLKTVIACNDAIPSGNDVHHIDVSSLSELPKSVYVLSLADNNLTAIPAELIKNSPGLEYLYLERNMISSLNFDGSAGSKLSSLYLSENPITKIDVTFQPIALDSLYLQQTELTTIDLSIFSRMNLEYLSFDKTPSLKTLTMSGEPPGGQGYISFNGCGLETIHPSVSGIFGQDSKKTSTLKITNCKKLQCDKNMAWMAKPVFCGVYRTISTYQSECLNLKKTLDEHLKKLLPKHLQKSLKITNQ